MFFLPTVAVWFGWHGLFGTKMFAAWIVDYIFAYAFGIVFQYFTIAPMRGLSFGPGIWAAIKADALSLTAWLGGVLVHDADRDALRLRDDLSGELVAD